ncbi:unnamed protein product [Blepharisma stoltei]|uniref:Uncharacterized protein n=1 Tax=Blepharisma stoltei TaxID=1481888 RepID=A0AAU9ILL7_9CILI|nr:unnamed protein product [Blepharisma stoltei]
MAKLESFDRITKLQEDLLEKGYCFNQIAAISLYAKAADDLKTKSSIRQIPSDNHIPITIGSVYFSYSIPQFLFKQEIFTSKFFKSFVEYTNPKYPNSTLQFELDHNADSHSQKKSISIEQITEKHRTKFSITDYPSLNISTVAKHKNFGCGLELALGLRSLRFITYNAALFWSNDRHRIGIKHISTDKKEYSLGNLVCSMYYDFKKDLKLGSSFIYTSEKTVEVKFGCQYRFSPDLIIKTRGDSEGALGIVLRNRINEYLTVVSASQFNVKSLSQNRSPKMDFSFKVKINE